MSLLRSHWGFFLLAAVAVPLIGAFCWHDGIATIGDDSVSYLVLARHFAGEAGPLLEPWVARHAHFGPLFPLALAVMGGGSDLLMAHMVVAAFAIAALAAIYAHGREVSGRMAGGVLLAALFLLAPTAWTSIKGILSEAMFLALSLFALHFHATRLREPDAPPGEWVSFGVLLAGAYLTRTAGVALVLAYAAHAAVRLARTRGAHAGRLAIPVAMTLAAAAAWILLRPSAPVDGYRHTAGAVLGSWTAHPALMLFSGARFLLGGWMNGFVAEGDVSIPVRAILVAAGALAVAGALLRAARNHLDGWYVLATLAMLLAWVFEEENMRRLLYPVVPVMLAQAGWAIAAACRRLGRPQLAGGAVVVASAALAAACVPAVMVVAYKARDTRPLLEDTRHGAAHITDYYRIANVPQARAVAARHAAIIAGLEALERATPPSARILWARPEYVALLGNRQGVPLEYRWDERALAEAVRREKVDYILATMLAKTDLVHGKGDAMAPAQRAAAYASPVLTAPNAVTGAAELVLLQVDRRALERYLER
ncbi:MAG TPA: hypothetical protein VFK48_15235 [Usitatibacter sp.]|nr:hypothetical protein [Usitatibacter sp.]